MILLSIEFRLWVKTYFNIFIVFHPQFDFHSEYYQFENQETKLTQARNRLADFIFLVSLEKTGVFRPFSGVVLLDANSSGQENGREFTKSQMKAYMALNKLLFIKN